MGNWVLLISPEMGYLFLPGDIEQMQVTKDVGA